MSTLKKLEEQVEKSHEDFLAAVEREVALFAQWRSAVETTNMFEDVYLAYKKALLTKELKV